MLWPILLQFVFRLSLGLATSMAVTSPKLVQSGFFRVHLWVLLGLGTFGSLIASSPEFSRWTLVLAIGTSVLCYVGSVVWLIESQRWGMPILWVIMALCLAINLSLFPQVTPASNGTGAESFSWIPWGWFLLDMVTGSLLLGATFAAMLLGHWYLNSPSMKLDPLRWLIGVAAVALVSRIVVCGFGLGSTWIHGGIQDGFTLATIALRWLAGLLGLAGMFWMTWQTLKIPNTQSATGILYVALVFVFIGELASAMLSSRGVIPI